MADNRTKYVVTCDDKYHRDDVKIHYSLTRALNTIRVMQRFPERYSSIELRKESRKYGGWLIENLTESLGVNRMDLSECDFEVLVR